MSAWKWTFFILERYFCPNFWTNRLYNKKRLWNTNLVASTYFQMKNSSLPVGMRCSKMPLLKFRVKWSWISLEAAHSHREISTFCQSFQVYLVFQSCSHVGAKEAAVMKAGNKVLWVRWSHVRKIKMASYGLVQNCLGFNPFPLETIKCS